MITEAMVRDVARLYVARRAKGQPPGKWTPGESSTIWFHADPPERQVARVWIFYEGNRSNARLLDGDLTCPKLFCSRKHICVMALVDPAYFAERVRHEDWMRLRAKLSMQNKWNDPATIRHFGLGKKDFNKSAAAARDKGIRKMRDAGRLEVSDAVVATTFRVLAKMEPWVRQAQIDIAAIDAERVAMVEALPVPENVDPQDEDAIMGGDW